MATEAIVASLRRRTSMSMEAFLAPVDLSGVPLVRTLASISAEIVSCFRSVRFFFQRRNSRSLIRKIHVFIVLFEYLADSSSDSVSSTAMLCFNELYLLLHHSKLLLHYCAHSSKLWLLLHPSVSGVFHDLNRNILTLLDVFPVNNLGLSDDIREQIELLHKQSSKSRLLVDNNDEEMLRDRLYSFLHGFEKGQIPNSEELRYFFLEKLGIRDPLSCRAEIEFLEEQMVSYDSDLEPTGSVINGFVDITRYAMFLLFGFEDGLEWRIDNTKKQRNSFIAQEIGATFTTTVPKDFVCSISLSLMKDPVIVSTGQTYDRSSIARWIEEGHSTCPKTRQMLVDKSVIPNRALRSLITRWCAATGISHESPNESIASVLQTRASMEATKATVSILIQNLADDSESAKAVAAREIRLLAKTAVETRTLIAEAGAIPHLRRLLKTENATAQENSVTAMFNLSLDEKNKSRIMEEDDCLEPIVSVLASGLTMEARGNAAATLSSLSAVNGYEKRIANTEGCIESLISLLQNGTPRGKKDAINALYRIWSHPDNCSLMVKSGGVSALVGALSDEAVAVAEKAAEVLDVVAYQSLGAESIGREETAVAGLIQVMRCGTPRGKEKAIAILLQVCISGGAVVVDKVVRTPALEGLTQKLLLTGTDRAKRKANSLARVLKGCENTAMMRSGNREGGFRTDVSVPISIPVSVL